MHQCRLQNLQTAMHRLIRADCWQMVSECATRNCSRSAASACREQNGQQLTCPKRILRTRERDEYRICAPLLRIGRLRGLHFPAQSQTRISRVTKRIALRDVKILGGLVKPDGMPSAVFALSLHHFRRTVAEACAVAKTVAGESMVTIAIAVFCVGGRQPRRQTRVLRSAEGRANAPCVCQLVTMLDQF